MSGNKHFRRALVSGLVISALLIGVGFWQSVTMGNVCLVSCGALLAIFCLYTRNQTREIRRLSDYLTTLVNGTAPLLVPANNQEGELSLLENNIYKTARKLQTQAELMQKDKTYLADALADVSHQLKTPITSMTVMTDLLLEEDLPAEKRLEFLKGISAQLEKMQWMITTLLKISKFDAGTAVLHKEPVELAAVVEQALAPFIIQAELRQMTLAVDCRQGQFLGDRLWTVEAVQNIVKNCLEHMDNGGTLRLTGTQTALYCQLVIADDGCGIEKEDLPHIFERFYKGKNAGADSVGIGLALSKSVLNRENATVEVQSTVGVGFCNRLTVGAATCRPHCVQFTHRTLQMYILRKYIAPFYNNEKRTTYTGGPFLFAILSVFI